MTILTVPLTRRSGRLHEFVNIFIDGLIRKLVVDELIDATSREQLAGRWDAKNIAFKSQLPMFLHAISGKPLSAKPRSSITSGEQGVSYA